MSKKPRTHCLGACGCRLRAWSKWGTTCRFSTRVVRSVKGSSWSTNKAYKEVIFLSACSSRCVKEKKILGFLKTVPSGPLICFSWQFKALLHIGYWSLYLATDFIDVLFRALNVTFFAGVPFLAHPRVLRNETVSELIVTTATSVKKCFLLSANSKYLNERCWFLWAIRISLLARSKDNSHSIFLWVDRYS